MSTVASQLILHPFVSQTLKVLGTTLGRDKIYRAVQYFSRFLAWHLLSRGYKIEAARWNALKSHLTLARKLMRIGKPLEHLQAALRAAQSPGEVAEQITTICRQLGYFGYLSYDMLVWANTVKFFNFKPSTAQKVSKNANRFWLAAVLFSITHGLLKAGRLANEVGKLRSAQLTDKGGDADRELKLNAIQKAREVTRHQFIIDLFDVWIPATNIGLVNLNDGVLGIFGLITSLLALQSQWIAVNRK
ncbi:peroxisomal biogenesis factor 11 [Laetiporus sulphureus 93-53]|uniref:Peroxisomal biogenesis factor 11 n=1 Tax=Laetiporus sulphureus 93-53 TaxID=1314785 RepID=A0A165EDQ8_9APHY|nr:peroxisomal biogenesis factor 11 [Laetiporus sulphureus 93-53]KZT06820.1 peroxisomal biogenesis factor 11 [Laetiporus sulphureus 93-53]